MSLQASSSSSSDAPSDIKRTDGEQQMQSSEYKYLPGFLVSCLQAWTGYGGVLLPHLCTKGVQKFEPEIAGFREAQVFLGLSTDNIIQARICSGKVMIFTRIKRYKRGSFPILRSWKIIHPVN